jgi:hypothetical protein
VPPPDKLRSHGDKQSKTRLLPSERDSRGVSTGTRQRPQLIVLQLRPILGKGRHCAGDRADAEARGAEGEVLGG